MQSDREDGQQPAAEEALLRAHVEHEEERRGHEDERAGGGPRTSIPMPAEDAGDERDPAEAPGERPQVVELAGGLRQPELAEVVLGGRGLVVEAVAERREVEDARTGWRRRTRRARAPREDEAAERGRAGVTAGGRLRAPAARRAAGRRREQRQQHDARRVLGRARQAEADAGERVVEQAPAAQHAGGAPQRQRERRERRDVVEREVRVEDRQERDRQERRGEQADAAVEEARAGEVQQPHRERPEDRGRDARDDEHLGRVGRAKAFETPVAAAEPRRRTRRAAGTRTPAG